MLTPQLHLASEPKKEEHEKLEFQGDFKATLLSEELFVAFPKWRYDGPLGPTTDVSISHRPGEFIVMAPSKILNEKKVSEIVENHDPSKLSRNETAKIAREEKIDSIKSKLKQETSLTDDEIELLLE